MVGGLVIALLRRELEFARDCWDFLNSHRALERRDTIADAEARRAAAATAQRIRETRRNGR